MKGDCHMSFPNSDIFSYNNVIWNSYEFYFLFFLKDHKGRLEDHRWSVEHSLRNTTINCL